MPEPSPSTISRPEERTGAAEKWGAWLLVAAALSAYWLFYQPAGGREWGLWRIFAGLAQPTVWGPAPFPWLKLLAGYMLTLGLGWVILRCFRLPGRPAWYEQAALGYILGAGATGLIGELAALAHLLDGPILWAGFIFTLGLAAWPAWKRGESGADARAAEPQAPATEPPPAPRWQNAAAWLFLVLTGLIFFLIGWHALLYPVTYWDAMILYVGYARLIYLEGGIPEYVVGQVGIGLGANYPHLFAFHHVALCRMLSFEWTSIFAQGVSPACGLAIVALLFGIVRRLGGGWWAAAATALASVSFHYVIAYYQYASNYPLAMALTAAFLWATLVHFQTRSLGALALAVAAAALAVHVNYLMWALWLAGLLAISLPAWRRELWLGRRFWTIAAAGLLVASPWYVRNVIVTGNPVYAFYSNIFPSKRVNPEVMESAAHEWIRNGDGIGTHALNIYGPDYTFFDKLKATPVFFATGAQAYKLGPVFLGWMVPGSLLAALLVGRGLRRRRLEPVQQLALVAGFLALFFLFYHYAVADFYLYQILPFVVAMAVFAGTAFLLVERVRTAAAAATALLVATALVPGLAFALNGLKNPTVSPQLTTLHLPLMRPDDFYRLRYGGDVEMWNYINEHLRGEKLLTHENRHLVLDPSIRIVQLDDWEMQAAYDLPTPEEKLEVVLDEGIRYYLYVPNEEKHPINLRLGIREFVGTPVLREVFRAQGTAGPNILFEIVPEALEEGGTD